MNSPSQKLQFLTCVADKLGLLGDIRIVFFKRFDENNQVKDNSTLAIKILWNNDRRVDWKNSQRSDEDNQDENNNTLAIKIPRNNNDRRIELGKNSQKNKKKERINTPTTKFQNELTKIYKMLRESYGENYPVGKLLRGRPLTKKSPFLLTLRWLYDVEFPKWQAEQNRSSNPELSSKDLQSRASNIESDSNTNFGDRGSITQEVVTQSREKQNLSGIEQESNDNKWTALLNVLISHQGNRDFFNVVKNAYLSIISDVTTWFRYRKYPETIADILKQLEDVSYINPDDIPIFRLVVLVLTKDIPAAIHKELTQALPIDIRKKLEQVVTNEPTSETNVEEISTQPLPSYLQIYLHLKESQGLFVRACFILNGVSNPLIVNEQQAETPFDSRTRSQILQDLIQQCNIYIKGQPTEINIEIFLPTECLFNEWVDKYLYQDEFEFDVSIVRKYKVVVRSSERAEKIHTETGYNLRSKWKKVQQIWNDDSCINQVFTIDEGNFDDNKLQKLQEKLLLSEKTILVVSCSLSNLDQQKLCRVIHSAGIPIVLWSRCDVKDLSNPQEFDAIVERVPLKRWTERITELRRESALDTRNENHLGNTIFVMIDNPNRVVLNK